MKNKWSKIAVVAACSVLSASAWAQSDEYKTGHANAESLTSNQTSRVESDRHLSATGRSFDRSVRASQLRGASIQDSSGERIGQIQDLIVNPTSGKIDFAVISLSGQGGASSPSGSTYGSSTSQSGQFGDQATSGTGSITATNSGAEYNSTMSTASTSGKLIPVPWSLLKPAEQSSEYSSSNMRQQQSFTLNVDQSKLQDAPAIERGSWSDIGQSEWRDRVYSHYGVSADSASGAAESPSGAQKGHEAEKLIENQNQ